MADHEEGPLSRWSRLKRESEAASTIDEVKQGDLIATEQPGEPGETGVSPETGGQQQIPIEDLPDIETLTYQSDFTVFLRDGVPDVLRRMALAKLWRTDPILANLDGLNDYDEDYRIIAATDGPLIKLIEPESRAELAMDREARRPRRETHARDVQRKNSPAQNKAANANPSASEIATSQLSSGEPDDKGAT